MTPKSCPCQSQKSYLECCGPCLQNKVAAKTPEALMRSRYTAFVEENFAYLRETMRDPALAKYGDKMAERTSAQWLGLDVISSSISKANPAVGFVDFKARYARTGVEYCIHEKSEFHLIDGEIGRA